VLVRITVYVGCLSGVINDDDYHYRIIVIFCLQCFDAVGWAVECDATDVIGLCHNYLATETAVTGVNVELTSDATVYEDCAAVTVSSQPEWNLTLTSHECRSTLSHLLCQTGKFSCKLQPT